MWQQARIAVVRARSQAVAMFTRLLLKLAWPVPSLKRRAAVRRLLNTARYPLKTRTIDTRRRIIPRRIHQPSKIRRATQTQKLCYSIAQCIRAAFANIFVANIFAPHFWKRFAKYFCRENFVTYGIVPAAVSSATIFATLCRC